MQGLKLTTVEVITVSLDMRIVNILFLHCAIFFGQGHHTLRAPGMKVLVSLWWDGRPLSRNLRLS